MNKTILEQQLAKSKLGREHHPIVCGWCEQ
jgi:hypothetical protein